MPARTVDPSKIKQDENGCSITETDATTVKSKDGNNDNFGGLIFRVDVDKLGGYGITVNCTSETTSSNTWIAPTGMQASRITEVQVLGILLDLWHIIIMRDGKVQRGSMTM